MKLVIAGSRGWTPTLEEVDAGVCDIITDYGEDVTEVVCGMAKGGDLAGKAWGEANSVSVKKMPADWNRHGRGAGHIRNAAMAQYADAVLVFWDGSSPGSANMATNALAAGKPCRVVTK